MSEERDFVLTELEETGTVWIVEDNEQNHNIPLEAKFPQKLPRL